MMLAFIYLISSAKPISIRRLCLLYVLAFTSAASVLFFLRAQHAAATALDIGAAITFLVWVFPLVRLYVVFSDVTHLDSRRWTLSQHPSS
jgi:hypothetical protein